MINRSILYFPLIFLTACWQKPASFDMAEYHGPFPPLQEQMWHEDDTSYAKLQELGILPKSIQISPSFLQIKSGEIGPVLQARYEVNRKYAEVKFEVIAPHLHESERAYVNTNHRLTIPENLQHKTEFIVRARLKKNPMIYDDLMVMINQGD